MSPPAPAGAAAVNTQRTALIMALSFFMLMLDGTILNTSLPLMAQGLGVTPLALTAGITSYLLAAAATMPVSGWLADRFEARRMFLLALSAFTLASVGCALAQTLPQLVAARVLQGVAAGLMAPIGRTLVLRQASKGELMAVTALLTWPALLAPVLGPALGGFISTYAGWRWNFLINLPVGLIGLLATLRWVPRAPVPRPPPLDWAGAAWCAAALVLLLQGLESAALAGPHPAAWTQPLLLLLVAALTGAWALRHLRRTAHPVLSLAPLRVPTFAIATLSGGTVFMACLQATPFLLPLMLQLGFGMDAVQAGLYTLVYFLGNLLMKTVTTPLLKRWGFARVMRVGAVLAAGAIGGCALLQATTPVLLTLGLLLLAGGFRSLQMTALNTLSFADIEAAHRGAASTLSSLCAQLAMALAAALASLMLGVSQAAHGRQALAVADFQWAFAITAAVALAASAAFWRLAPDAGAEVSGHRRAR